MARIKFALVAVVAAVAMFPGAAEARHPRPITTAHATSLAHQDFWEAAASDEKDFFLSEEGQLSVNTGTATGTPVQIHVKCKSAGGGWFTCQATALRVVEPVGPRHEITAIGEPSYWEDEGEVGKGGCLWYESGWIEPYTMQWPEYLHRGTAALDRLTRKEWKC